MLVEEVVGSERRWAKFTVPNPANGATRGFQNYKKPFNVFKRMTSAGERLYYNEAFDDLTSFKRSERTPYEYVYNVATGKISRRMLGDTGVWTVVETSLDKNGVDGGRPKPVGKPKDLSHAWSAVIHDYSKIRKVSK